jgi:hypothetical protein
MRLFTVMLRGDGAWERTHLFVGEHTGQDLSHALDQSLGYHVEFVGRIDALCDDDVGKAYYILEHLCNPNKTGPALVAHSGT